MFYYVFKLCYNLTMRLFVFHILFLALACFSFPAHASFWLHCAVDGKVIEADENSFKAEVLVGVVLGGHQEIGDACLKAGDTYDIEMDNHGLSAGDSVVLDYNYFDSMGPDGYISDTKWKILPSLDDESLE